MLDQFSAVRPDRIRVMPASCGWAFRIFVLIYGCVVVTLTCMEFTEMMAFQVTMTIARYRISLCCARQRLGTQPSSILDGILRA